ncbi:MAG: TSUP family transporter [Nitriliruptorales bacterium]|nr:TSUP family transporter [Nitriliruptorales bacterium]
MSELTPGAVAVIALAVALGAFAKSVTGMGLPLVSVPVIATFLGVETAVVVMALPTLVTNAWMLLAHRAGASQTRDLPVLLTTGAVGVVVGTVILRTADPRWLALGLAIVIFAYLAMRILHPALVLPPSITRRLSPFVGAAAGLAQGATGVSGPVVSTYVHAYRLPPSAFLFSTNALFQVFVTVQVAAFLVTGLYRGRVTHSLLALIPVAVVFPLGLGVGRRIDVKRFDAAILALLFVSGLKQVADALGVF